MVKTTKIRCKHIKFDYIKSVTSSIFLKSLFDTIAGITIENPKNLKYFYITYMFHFAKINSKFRTKIYLRVVQFDTK